jgi:hypothetical protein
VSRTLGKNLFTFGNGFAECSARRTGFGKKKSGGEASFAGCFISGTRQNKSRKHSAKKREGDGRLAVNDVFA